VGVKGRIAKKDFCKKLLMKKGFTLIELVIVIGILAILAAAVVLVLNPAQLLAQARDSQRLSDLGSVKSAIALYLATADSPAVSVGPRSTAVAACAFTTCTVPSATDLLKVTGAGWVAVDISGTSGGSSLSSLPIDPINGTCGTATCQYAYKGNVSNKTFELDAVLESTKYAGLMANDKDGGDNASYYEIGTALNL